MNFEYGYIFVWIILSIVLAFVLFLVSYLLVIKNYDAEKISAYECGFDPFSDSRSRFDVRFYLVAILFIIFDLEITFLFPWSVSLYYVTYWGLLL